MSTRTCHSGIADVFRLTSLAVTKLVDSSAPWKLATDKSRHRELDAVLYHLADPFASSRFLISPVLSKAAHEFSIN